ncbi:type II toxin-antitoxin system RelE/ParE family toxin [Methylobacterium sp. Leaf85]|uniref:type II toxin-antitoxin system RelE/ParE family toxin n=1 Tax=Methylobacterium sp. Leaf85 TaxID=1736241 RepID=UPI0030837720
MGWQVELHHEFRREFDELQEAVQDELLAMIELLKVAGPGLRRPGADTLNGSKHANMKELRFEATMVSGGWPSPSILFERAFSSSPMTSPVFRGNVSIPR